MEDRLPSYREAVARDPENVMVRYLYALELLKASRFDEAATELRACVERKQDWSAAWRDLGKALAAGGRKDEARATYEQALIVAKRKGDLQTVREIEVFLRRLS